MAENHQFHNAVVLQKEKAAVLIEEKNYNKKNMISIVNSFYKDKEKLKTYSENAAKLFFPNTKQLILKEVKKLLT